MREKQGAFHEPSHSSDTLPDRSSLSVHVHPRRQSQRTYLHARPSLAASADAGWTDAEICEAFDISRNTAIRVRQLYLEGGLEAVLHDKQQQHRRQALSGGQAAHLVAIACTPAPDGHDHWTVRLLEGLAVELGQCPGPARPKPSASY